MNLAITTTSTNTWKAIKRHYFFGFTAAFLAIAALGASSMMSTDAGSSAVQTSPARSTLHIDAAFRPASPVMTYYIVDSEEQRAAIEAQASAEVADNAVYSPTKRWSFAVLVVGSPDDESDVRATIKDAKERWANAGASGLQVLDLRSR